MDKTVNAELVLRSGNHGCMTVPLSAVYEGEDFYDVPSGREVVYNNDVYRFEISGTGNIPEKIYINDERYDTCMYEGNSQSLRFTLKDCINNQPFLHSFGAVRIQAEIDGKLYTSKSMTVMVSDTEINNSVMNMINYIHSNFEHFLYREDNSDPDGKIVPIETKIELLEKIFCTYKDAYHYLKMNPFSGANTVRSVGNFNKLHSISHETVGYIVRHPEQLRPVNYNTGIKYDRRFYEPEQTLIQSNRSSFDVYENQAVLGFLKTVSDEISRMIKYIHSRSYTKKKTVSNEKYFDSMYSIFSASIKKIQEYSLQLSQYREKFQRLYYRYRKLFNIKETAVRDVPAFTPVFRNTSPYRQIYQEMYEWFSCPKYDLGKEELLLSFASTSKIYEYYCLVKLLCFLDKYPDMNFSGAEKNVYTVSSRFSCNDTRYNNTFTFCCRELTLTLFFQPVIYGDDSAVNGIRLFRNTSSNCKSGNENKGRIYMPDYLIKIDYGSRCEYLILDAKFSTPANIRKHQLQELVYKYLFSLSPLCREDAIIGLYIICGKTTGSDEPDIVHDLANRIKKPVRPFAEILIMNGTDTADSNIPTLIFKNIL